MEPEVKDDISNIQYSDIFSDVKMQITAVKVWKKMKISTSADGGPRSRVRARGTPRSAPHRH